MAAEPCLTLDHSDATQARGEASRLRFDGKLSAGGDAERHYGRVPLLLPNDDPCSFCEYLAGRRPYTILFRDELTATLVTREQRGRGHVLVIPVAHRATILDLAPEEEAVLLSAVSRAARTISAMYDADGVAVWQNNGTPAHQTVPHVHFHVAATLPDGGTHWGPVPTLTISETDALGAMLREHDVRTQDCSH